MAELNEYLNIVIEPGDPQQTYKLSRTPVGTLNLYYTYTENSTQYSESTNFTFGTSSETLIYTGSRARELNSPYRIIYDGNDIFTFDGSDIDTSYDIPELSVNTVAYDFVSKIYGFREDHTKAEVIPLIYVKSFTQNYTGTPTVGAGAFSGELSCPISIPESVASNILNSKAIWVNGIRIESTARLIEAYRYTKYVNGVLTIIFKVYNPTSSSISVTSGMITYTINYLSTTD